MSLAKEFRQSYRSSFRAGGEALIPDRLAAAVVGILPIDGASLSVAAGGSRVPLGASDHSSAQAERLQFTVGEGPCLAAMSDGRVVNVDSATLRKHWPLLSHAWRQRTPFRSALAVPLILVGHARAAIDLYFISPEGARGVEWTQIAEMAELVSQELRGPLEVHDGARPPRWLDLPAAARRQRVWVAVGLVMARSDVPAADVLHRLRTYALTRDLTLDEVADRLVERPHTVYDMRGLHRDPDER